MTTEPPLEMCRSVVTMQHVVINGIHWRTRTGAPWRDVPARYGEWETVYGLFRRWQHDGTWSRIRASA